MQTPILVGVAQLQQRIDQANQGKEPLELMIDATRAAAEDAACPALLTAADSVRVIRGLWPYGNPGRAIAQAIGNASAESAITPFGGNFVQTTLNRSALEIQAGTADVIILTGAECGNSQAKARKAGIELNWSEVAGTPDRTIGEAVPMRHDVEKAMRIGRATQVYPILEIARRHHLGEDVDAHLKRISELWSGFSAVAADNPHAWIREAKTALEIRTPSAINRPISYPYPKFMNSNNNVDQAAALILCSEAKATALGIHKDKWVYPWVGTDAHDCYFVSNRDNLYSSPAMRLAGGRALELADTAAHDLDMVDVYSCFPVAVQVAAAELGLDTDKPLTVTGGLTFGGGPLNNYVMHSIARMAELLRSNPGTKGLITANGGYITKHAFGVYSTEPPAKPFQHEDLQKQADATPLRKVLAEHTGVAEVEAYTVMYGAEGPEIAHLACRLTGGERVWANCEDRETITAMTAEEFCGRPVRLSGNAAHF